VPELTRLLARVAQESDEEPFMVPERIERLKRIASPVWLRHFDDRIGLSHDEFERKARTPAAPLPVEDSLPERIMALADIFEALTASDRPYKKANTLSESIRIMSFMRKDGHICPDLFELFLRSGAYLEYARTYLNPAQVDTVDVAQYLGGAGQV